VILPSIFQVYHNTHQYSNPGDVNIFMFSCAVMVKEPVCWLNFLALLLLNVHRST